MDAFKCLILLKVLDERFDQLIHFLRVLYSQAETFNFLAFEIMTLKDLMKEMYRTEMHKLQYKKVDGIKLFNYFITVKTAIEKEIKDSHLTVVEGYQARILNVLLEIEEGINEIKPASTT